MGISDNFQLLSNGRPSYFSVNITIIIREIYVESMSAEANAYLKINKYSPHFKEINH